jgi:hypothetical protein
MQVLALYFTAVGVPDSAQQIASWRPGFSGAGIDIDPGALPLAQAVMKAMQDRGWLALRFSPCAALRCCGRLDEHWCRARNATCDFPQVFTKKHMPLFADSGSATLHPHVTLCGAHGCSANCCTQR